MTDERTRRLWSSKAVQELCRPERVGLSTYSIVGADPETGETGVAVQSKFLAVGAVVPWARGGVGAVAVQAFPDITHGQAALDLIEEGLSPEETINRLLESDDLRQHRQIGIVTAAGASASFTGEECFEFAANTTGECFAAQGNVLRSDGVVTAMSDAFSNTIGSLAHRLMTALEAAEEAGGEKRGVEAAALVVVRENGGYGGNHDRWLDLRVDHSDRPIEDLRGLLDLHTLYFGKSRLEDLVTIDDAVHLELTSRLRSLGWWDESASLKENLFSWMGWNNLEERRVDDGLIDPLVLREIRNAHRGHPKPVGF